jgi:RNA polymerase sigma factor (sigma-70 family)
VELPSTLPLDGFQLSQNSCKPLSVKDLMDRYHSSLMSFLRQRLRVPDDAADVAQEAYIRMLQYEGSCDVRSPSSLLFRVAINIANDLSRLEQVRHASGHTSLDGLDIDSGLASPDREVEAEQELELLYEVIARLPPKCRQVFLLSRVQCMTYPEIASHCGISVKMVEKHVSHALMVCMRETEI